MFYTIQMTLTNDFDSNKRLRLHQLYSKKFLDSEIDHGHSRFDGMDMGYAYSG